MVFKEVSTQDQKKTQKNQNWCQHPRKAGAHYFRI